RFRVYQGGWYTGQALGPRPGRLDDPRHIAEFIRESRVSRLMVAGTRESREPGIGEGVERFLILVFKSLATMPRRTARPAPAGRSALRTLHRGGPAMPPERSRGIEGAEAGRTADPAEARRHAEPTGLIHLKVATAAELEALPGIGPVIARR